MASLDAQVVSSDTQLMLRTASVLQIDTVPMPSSSLQKLCSRTTEALGAAVGARRYGQWGTEATRGDIETRRKHAYAPRCSYLLNAAGLPLRQRFSDRCRSSQNTPRTETRCLKDIDKTNRWPRTEAGSSAAILGRAEAFLAVLTHNTLMIEIATVRVAGLR